MLTKNINLANTRLLISPFSPYIQLRHQQLITNNYQPVWRRVTQLFYIYHHQQTTLFWFSSANGPSNKVSTMEQIFNACTYLLKFNTLLIDDLCVVFGKHQLVQQVRQPQDKTILSAFSAVYKQYCYEESDVEVFKHCQKIQDNIRKVYRFLSESKMGFLKGDIHSNTFSKLRGFIAKRYEKKKYYQNGIMKDFKQRDFQTLFKIVTNESSFRLPAKGIYARKEQCKKNLYKRQIWLQEVAGNQATAKLKNILEKLAQMKKMQQAQIVRSFLSEWIKKTTAQVEIEMKSKTSKLYILKRGKLQKINPEKIVTLALSQLLVEIFEVVWADNPQRDIEILDFYGINGTQYLFKIGKMIESQLTFESESKKFCNCQREYDKIINEQSKQRRNQQKLKQKAKELNQTIKKKQESIKQAQYSPKNQQQKVKQQEFNAGKLEDERPAAQNFFWKSQGFKIKQKQSPYRYIKQQSRSEYLFNLSLQLARFSSKIEINTQIQEFCAELLNVIKAQIKVKNHYGFYVPLLTIEHKFVTHNKDVRSIQVIHADVSFVQTLLPQLEKRNNLFIHMERCVPTIIKPRPWTGPQLGGYYSQATAFMRYSDCPLQERLVKQADNSRIYKVLNFLSRTPWKINKKVLSIMQQIWQQGGQVGEMPKRYSQSIATITSKLKQQTDYQVRRQLQQKLQSLRDQHSLRSDFNLKLNISRSFANLDYFYFPQNLDFRGRVYPIPPHFNHIGNDLARGLLLFGEGRKLGPTGLKWLKIHTANLMEMDKATISEKLAFIDANIQKIKQTARDPLKNRKWLSYSDCWQAIASIIELYDALESPDPEQYVSYLHIHQDGSCNGLQHYAALGRDLEGAIQVNLSNLDRPGDIYTHVAKLVKHEIDRDANNPGSPKHELAIKLADNIKRKTIKQTVMTSVYGVTFIGARKQIGRQLKDQAFLSDQDVYPASIYVSNLALKAIEDLFTGAQKIKLWFRKCARLACKVGHPMGWFTPMGLPVVQPYQQETQVDVTSIVGMKVRSTKDYSNIRLNRSKQGSAFPPNYVHSLDSTHMMYTAEVCQRRGLTFAAVHDSYWTHAGTVEQMNTILRQQFVRLHSQPLLQSLKQSLQTRFPSLKFPDIPERGSFNLQKVKQSLYFFS